MIKRWILLGLYVIVTLQTSADHCRNTPFLLRIDPAYQRAYSNALKRWYGGASCDTVCTKLVEEHDRYGNDLADS
jgi:hypothetical protein